MYTIKKFLDKTGDVAELAKGQDLAEALAKADAIRKQGWVVEIFDDQGRPVSLSEKSGDRNQNSAV